MNINATIIADSINLVGEPRRITTFQITLPKALLAENNTHRQLSRNYSSSRAIPNKNFVNQDTFEPIVWKKNQAGMVASDEVLVGQELEVAQAIWNDAVEYCRKASIDLSDLGLHKQWSNRLNDWHAMATGVVTATELDNFFWLRDHPDAQPEICELARKMKEAMSHSTPELLKAGQWHTPYVKHRIHSGHIEYLDDHGSVISLEDALKISASACAQVSYRKNDTSLSKAHDIWNRLIDSAPPHMSPCEHQATPMTATQDAGHIWEPGVTHMTRNKNLWSANFQGWIQHRHLIGK